MFSVVVAAAGGKDSTSGSTLRRKVGSMFELLNGVWNCLSTRELPAGKCMVISVLVAPSKKRLTLSSSGSESPVSGGTGSGTCKVSSRIRTEAILMPEGT